MSWKKVKLGDLCTIEKGKTGIQKAIPGEYPLVVTAEDRKSHNGYQFNDEAVIIPLVSGTGHGHASIKRLHFQSGKFALGTILCAVIPKDKTVLNAEYLFRFLNLNKERELVDRMKGMANVTLPIKEIAKIEIPLPSLEEQMEFVKKYALLETDSEDISLELTHQFDLIKQLRQAFLREAMQGKLLTAVTSSAVEKQATGHELLAQIKAEKAQLIAEKKLKKEKELAPIKVDEVPFEIPKHWAWCRLEEIAEIGTGATPLTSNEDYYKNGSIPWITSSATNNLFVEKPEQYITEKALKETNCKVFPVGTLVVAMYGQGKTRGQITELKFAAATNQACATITLYIENDYLRKFIKTYFQKIYEEIRELAQGGAQPNLNMGKIKSRIIPIPPLHEQEQIVAKLEELMAFCDGLEQSIKESQGYNEMLLQQVLREALQPKEEV